MRFAISFLLFHFVLSAIASAADLSPEAVKFFETHIRPLLAKSCYKCHSEAEGKTKGGLALDSQAGWKKGGETGPALVPGAPEKSLLVKAIHYSDPDLQMPPSSNGGKLTPDQISKLETWIKMGAPDPRNTVAPRASVSEFSAGLTEEMREKTKSHWAYQPLKSPPIPEVTNSDWPKSPVDKFILAKLEANSLQPSPEADKRTLIRRATFDLIGMPPSPKEVIDFVQDQSPDAFAKVVDRLLASPHYGERWGRYWLDVARYADTRGEVKKETSALSPFAWTYRDYVIKALNSDRPYNQFIKEQIAADQLPTSETHPGTLAALGFLTEGDQFQGNRNDIINDQIDVVCKGFLASTVTCARCHDHFFDPIPTRDYYSLHGIFNSSAEPQELPVISNSPDKKLAEDYLNDRKAIEAKGRSMVDNELCRLAAKFNKHAEVFLLAMVKVRSGQKANDPEVMKFVTNNGIAVDDLQAAMRALQVQAKAAMEQKMDRMEASTMEPQMSPKVVAPIMDKKERKAQGRQALRKFESPVLGIWSELTGRRSTGPLESRAESILADAAKPEMAGQVNPLVLAAFRGQKIISLDQAAKIYATVFAKAHDAYQTEHAAWKKTAPEHSIFPGLRDPALEQVRSAVFNSKAYLKLSFEEMQGNMTQEMQKSLGGIVRQLATMDLSHPGTLARANILVDAHPKDSPVLIRGEAKSPGPIVPRQFLEFLDPDRKRFPSKVSGRLQLAEAIAGDKNPLTSRVMVNRVWMHHFGEGFVSTPDDLGVMSEAPSHPELCNWLAARFIADGWSLKKLHRLIMNSAVYRQASGPNSAMAKVDPFNRLLWRANVRRLDFEALRDSLLAIGGKIDLTMFGHPMNIETEPYSPRRTIYGFVDRLNMAEFMKNFDMANAQLPTGRRHQTVVPQQSLFRMNSLLVIEQARNVIDRPEFKKALNNEGRIKALYEIIYQRWPRPEEIKLALTFIHASSDPKSAPAVGSSEEINENTKRERIEEFLARDPKSLDPKQRARQEQFKKRMAELAQKKPGQGGKLSELVSDPNAEKVDRSAMDNWEKFAHALLITNEVAYVN